MQEASIFTKIINGEVPGEIIYSDDTCIALLSHEPITTGHTLIIPKSQVDQLWDLDEEVYHHLFDVAKQVSVMIDKAYHYKRIGLVVEGFGVPHAHIHVFGYRQPLEPTIAEFSTNKHQASPDELKAVASKLQEAQI